MYNYLYNTNPEFYYGQYVNQNSVRRAIHVGNLTYQSGEKTAKNLEADMMQSVKPWLAEVMDHYKVKKNKQRQ